MSNWLAVDMVVAWRIHYLTMQGWQVLVKDVGKDQLAGSSSHLSKLARIVATIATSGFAATSASPAEQTVAVSVMKRREYLFIVVK